ncbi:tetratricopeptide repeat protein [Pedobacter sp. BS3]|nr:tetratricopeptide repeat protein [Pedobacter sp. BS3]
MSMVLPLFAAGNDLQPVFEKGNEQYAKSKYNDAITSYQQILDAGYQSAALYYNLGNAYYKNGRIAPAILNYEKAYRLSPGDEDIRFNIRFANSKITDKVIEAPELFIQQWWKGLLFSFTANTWAGLSVLLVLAASALFIVYLFAAMVSVKRTSFYAGLTLLILGCLVIIITNRQAHYFETHREAIVFTPSVTVKSSPNADSGNLFVLHEGTKVQLLENFGDWMRIRLANGNEGWISRNDAKEI